MTDKEKLELSKNIEAENKIKAEKESAEEKKAKEQEKAEEDKNRDYKTEAYIASQEYARMNIKSPSTAEFPGSNQAEIVRFNDSTYVVKSYLDAQNGYGAMLRANYSCLIVFKKNGGVQGLNFAIENQ